MSNIRTGSNLDLGGKTQLVSSTMQRFNTVANANSGLINDGMFGYVINDGIYLNINGVVTKVAPNISTSQTNYTFYQNTTPQGSLIVGMLWYNTTNSSLNIWSGVLWTQIGGNNTNMIPLWVANQPYLKDSVVIFKGDLWYNKTNNTIATPTFNTAEWENLSTATIKNYDLLMTHLPSTSSNNVQLDSSGKIFTISHSCGVRVPNIECFNKTTNEKILVNIKYETNDISIITLYETLTNVGFDIFVRVMC